MSLNELTERNIISFILDLFDYYKQIDDNSINVIYYGKASRGNLGWYFYNDSKHEIHINAPMCIYLKSGIEQGIININDAYAFISMCVGHEFRHFLQSRYTHDGIKLEGYNQNDVLRDELINYIKLFFDNYYLLNKAFLKPELDADKYSIVSSLDFLNKYNIEMDAKKSILNALRYYRLLQLDASGFSTIPHSNSMDEIINYIDRQIKINKRIPDLAKALTSKDLACQRNREVANLNHSKFYSQSFFDEYETLKSGYKRDLLVAKQILYSIDNPNSTLEKFPAMRKKFIKDGYLL